VRLETAAKDGDVELVRKLLTELVSGYSAFDEIVDLVSVQTRLAD
jgi:hypothetical protein